MITRVLTLVLIVMVVVGLTSQAQVKVENKYVGVKMCSMCHKAEKTGNQYGVWQKSKHAEAVQDADRSEGSRDRQSKGHQECSRGEGMPRVPRSSGCQRHRYLRCQRWCSMRNLSWPRIRLQDHGGYEGQGQGDRSGPEGIQGQGGDRDVVQDLP